jgi:phage repressor protein C with HTH and peptisase S24 domain
MESIDVHVLAANLERRRRELHLLKKEVAAAAGMDASMYGRYEAGNVVRPSYSVNTLLASPGTAPHEGLMRAELSRLDALEARVSQLEEQVNPLLDTSQPDRRETVARGEEIARQHIAAWLDRIGAVPVDGEPIELEDVALAAGEEGGGIGHSDGVPMRRSRPLGLYIVRVEGHCLEPEIKHGDYVEFDPEQYPVRGDLTVVAHDDRALVKYLDERDGVQWLLPIVGDPIQVIPGMHFVGVVKSIKRPPPRGPRLPR